MACAPSSTAEQRTLYPEGGRFDSPEAHQVNRSPFLRSCGGKGTCCIQKDLQGSNQVLARKPSGLISREAKVLHRGRQGRHTWVTFADPEGNEFCVSQSAGSPG
jgi:hypothetical protein